MSWSSFASAASRLLAMDERDELFDLRDEVVPLPVGLPGTAVGEVQLGDDLRVDGVEVTARDAVLGEEAVQVRDPLAVDREADLRFVDEIVPELRRVVPPFLLDRLADLPVGRYLLVLPAAQPHTPAKRRGVLDPRLLARRHLASAWKKGRSVAASGSIRYRYRFRQQERAHGTSLLHLRDPAGNGGRVQAAPRRDLARARRCDQGRRLRELFAVPPRHDDRRLCGVRARRRDRLRASLPRRRSTFAGRSGSRM